MTVSIFTSKFSNLGIAPLTIYHSVSLQFLWFYRLEFRSKCSGFLKRHLLKVVSLLEGKGVKKLAKINTVLAHWVQCLVPKGS